jgi:hypothetical protein
MRVTTKTTVLIYALLAVFEGRGSGQSSLEDLRAKVDTVVAAAYQSALARFPCELKAKGKAKMLRWQDVEKCLNSANDRVDWEDLSRQLRQIRENGGFQTIDLTSAVESSLSAQALPYSKVFSVKDIDALLPLSSSLLKFLPADSLVDLPVYDKSGKRIGTFSGVYTFEKVGEISGVRHRHSLFQYTDMNGNIQASPDLLLLDSFGIPWKGAISQPGFRLPSERLIPKH